MSETPFTIEGLRKFDRLDPLDAIVAAWTDPGSAPYWHDLKVEDLRRSMPVLARALDRAAEARSKKRASR